MKIISSMLFLIVGILAISVIIKYLWSYLVVRLFPGSVEQNLISKEISWRVSIIFAIIFILTK